ncbi:hypothetical protein BGX26_005584 [Mortierella sp. AD094]|nr:hypothetical protein BGX26_005584 [Mortierella sp. AD094]
MQGLETERDPKKRVLYEDWVQENQCSVILLVTSPVTPGSRLLDGVQNIPDVETLLLQLKQEQLNEQGHDVYISPRAKASANATKDFDLIFKVHEFLSSKKKVFLVLGDSGAGKSTFNRALEMDLWRKYGKTTEKIPLFIHLPAIKDLERDLVAERLRRDNFTENQIRELKLHHKFILICDGYDETQQTRNLYTSNRLNQPREWNAQMVISCRTEYTGADYKNCFQPTDRNNRENLELFQEAIISPFNKDQIRDYIDQYVITGKSLWKAEDYQQAHGQVPNLQDLVKNPFLLKLALDVLPQLLDAKSEFSTARITRVELYDEFVEQWIGRNQKRLRDMELSPRDKEAFRILSDSGFHQHGITYPKNLATEIYDKHEGNPVVEYSEHRDYRTWKKSFFDHSDGKNLLREAIPLVRNNDQYRFMHKSVLEYGLSPAVFDPSAVAKNTNQESRSSRRGSTSSALSFEAPDLIEEPATAIEQPLLDSPLGKRSFVDEPSILQFLAERAQQQTVFKEQLLAVIERSKIEKTARIAAANAITVLVKAGVQFNGADLRGIKIPGADLSYGVFDPAQLHGADLRKTKLHNIWLRKANLSGAEMIGAQFGELPFLQEDDFVLQCAYWHDGKTLAVGLRNGGFSLYDTSSWEKIKELRRYDDQSGWFLFSETSDRVAYQDFDCVLRLVDIKTGNCFQTLQSHTDGVDSVVYSPCGSKVASGSQDKTVRVWNVDTGECIHVLQDHNDMIYMVAYSPNGDQIASGSDDQTVRLWDVKTGECIRILQGHVGDVNCVAYSPNGNQVVSGSHDRTDHEGYVGGVSCSPNGDYIASGGEDGVVRLWNVETGNCTHTLHGHDSAVGSVAYSPNGNEIASGSRDKTARLWDVETAQCLTVISSFNGQVFGVAWKITMHGQYLVTGSSDKSVHLFVIGK